ncbi:hypothetical protein [Rhodovulum sulfidophilum]|uniref:hypothetical protein n=1 Tax=Rhodovulum sulfidophilum TaxID=35806 RepID=UPI000952B1D6|nr:hypothetical protein [Rhodovulum sulfidophilum]MBL3551914.1 hypothetical protein [Rhodovulum sulfidophilum]OLS49913.1 hypothetical protein BV379_17625 [Rhodovulum sulfidophilum]
MDSFAERAPAKLPVNQNVAARLGLQALTLLAVGQFVRQIRRQATRPDPRETAPHLTRTGLILCATGTLFAALREIPLAEATATFFIGPFILSVPGAFSLEEAVSWRRILASAIGFPGAMPVIWSGFAAFGSLALLPLATALCLTPYMALTRQIARRMPRVAQ